ncbi:MAG: ammonium transporter, partial [Treponema porcinum]|nr:ammonium transporter [Treponema porcinum]
KLRIDDPVGAVAVHCLNGIWGTLAVGLFATPSAPGYGIANAAGEELKGLFYGGGFELLGIQLLGFVSVAAWTAITITVVFLVIKLTVGLRVSAEEEIVGLDKLEHGLDSGYAGFMTPYSAEEFAEAKEAGVSIPVSQAVPVTKVESSSGKGQKLSKVVIITRQTKFDVLKAAMNEIGVTGMTVSNVMGCGMQKGATEYYRGTPVNMTLLPKIKVEIVVAKVPVDEVVKAASTALYTGHIGDGKIFVYDVENVIKVRTSEQGFDALQDSE